MVKTRKMEMKRKAMTRTKMKRMRPKKVKKWKKSPRSLDTSHQEEFQIHLRKLLRNRNSSCKQEKMLWQNIQTYLRIDLSKMNRNHSSTSSDQAITLSWYNEYLRSVAESMLEKMLTFHSQDGSQLMITLTVSITLNGNLHQVVLNMIL